MTMPQNMAVQPSRATPIDDCRRWAETIVGYDLPPDCRQDPPQDRRNFHRRNLRGSVSDWRNFRREVAVHSLPNPRARPRWTMATAWAWATPWDGVGAVFADRKGVAHPQAAVLRLRSGGRRRRPTLLRSNW